MINIKLADVCIALDNRFPDLETFCRDYITDEPAQMVFRVTPEEIEAERSSQSYVFPEGYLETVCIYRKIALEMLQHDVFIMHASVLEVDGEGYAFLAHSGTGKSTQTFLWLKHFGERARVINGDKPLVRMVPHGDGWKFIAYGTPWNGKEGMGCNASVPLKALFLLERSTDPTCEPADQEYSIDRLFHQLLMPEKPEQVMQLLDMVDKLVETIPCYRLKCDMTDNSVVAAYHASKQSW